MVGVNENHLRVIHWVVLSLSSGSDALTPMDVVKTCCQNFSEALQLATDHRFAHEYGDTAVADELGTRKENVPVPGVRRRGNCHEVLSVKVAPCFQGGCRVSELKAAVVKAGKESRSRDAAGGTDFGDTLFSAKKRRSFSLALIKSPVIDYEDLQK